MQATWACKKCLRHNDLVAIVTEPDGDPEGEMKNITAAREIIKAHMTDPSALCAIKSSGFRTGPDDTILEALVSTLKGGPSIKDSLVDSAFVGNQRAC